MIEKGIKYLISHYCAVEAISSTRKLGMGENNINYALTVNGHKYLCRINLHRSKSNFISEYRKLRIMSALGISPKPVFLYDKKPQYMILEFVEGKPFRRNKKTYDLVQLKLIAKALAIV